MLYLRYTHTIDTYRTTPSYPTVVDINFPYVMITHILKSFPQEGLTPLIVAIKGPEYYFEEAPSTKSRIATVEVLLTGKASVETQEQVHTFLNYH